MGDVCLPTPCTEAFRSVCTRATDGTDQCSCNAGYRLDADRCVPDETCTAARCSGHGTCSLMGGIARCACAEGFTGNTCSGCAPGFHADGSGSCTTDPCMPNPCAAGSVTHRSTCVAVGVDASCRCDAGYHDDGAGACTTDPCAPDPCLALGQACRNAAGVAECFTPMCDDDNPCTMDGFAGGRCVHAALANGTSCTTSLCLTGERCMAGACVLGAARSRDDASACTRDSCSETSGCQHVNDGTLVPDDGVACTVDVCSAGGASHTVSHAACDDGLWCTGTEACVPAAAGADPRGCVHNAVPAPPAASGCTTYGACSEATHSFPIVPAAVGTRCDDGIGCTTMDQCTVSGACVGTVLASCPASSSCASTSALGGTLDLPAARVMGNFSLAGGAFPTTTNTDGSSPVFYLVSRETGQRHLIGVVQYNYVSTKPREQRRLCLRGAFCLDTDSARLGAATQLHLRSVTFSTQCPCDARTLDASYGALPSGRPFGPSSGVPRPQPHQRRLW